ncbi:MAG: NYN domain-containing protein [Planctomycetes bacterium]|nr:NYN domain-containing protein [Planctomycetota bacterium]
MIKTGIYVDAENIRLCGGYGMRYDVLNQYASLSPSVVLRANSYVVEDHERIQREDDYRRKLYRYHDILRSCGFKLIKKFMQRYVDADGEVKVKANADMDLAIDALLQSRNLDRIILLSGDGDYERLILALQNRGCRVEVIGFRFVSHRLKEVADSYVSGFLIPGLLPQENGGPEAEIRRGYPVSYWTDKGYGFMRTLEMKENGLEKREIYFHHSHLAEELNPHMLVQSSNVFEFNVVPSTVKEGDVMATNIHLAYRDIVT